MLGVTKLVAATRYEGGIAMLLMAIVARQENAVIDFKAERDEYESQKLEDDAASIRPGMPPLPSELP